MIDLHFAATPNGWKITIILEELGLPYRVVPVDLGAGAQFAPEFLAISPNNRIPAIIDHEPADGGAALAVFESGAILRYLADKTGRFGGEGLRGRLAVDQWLMWQMAGLGPMLGQNGHFRLYAPERLPYPTDRYAREADRLYGVLDRQLAATGAHVAGADYTIADIACFPWIITHKAQGIDMARFPHVARWFAQVRVRPAVVAGTAVGRMARPDEITAEAKRVMMGIGG
ncbi:glutathione S-transferase N-terminal domain-containing protein [Sphingomonas sp.]|uniref:glutathione S-transferase N-terminal domain-containing protein n=1 Tax=Sphingomonas sp. TaxID=28214 RepID=UPI0035C80255